MVTNEDIVALITSLSKKLDKFPESSINRYQSEKIDLIMAALSKAQGGYKKLVPNELTIDGRFANLEAILDSCRAALSDNEISFFQYIELQDEGSGAALLKTTLGHSSGQWISSFARVISGKTDRQTGNNYETHKRLNALMLLGIAPSKYDPIAFDDNGLEQSEEVLVDTLRKPKENRLKEYRQEVINKDNYNELLIAIGDNMEILKDILSVYGITTLADLPKEEYHKTLDKIRKIRRTEEDYLRTRK